MPLCTNVLSPITLTTRFASSGGSDMAHPQTYADARAHAHQRVHRLERRQHAKRITADVARHKAIQILQRGVNGAMRAARTQRRRLAWDRLCSGEQSPSRMRRTRSTFNSPKRYISGLPSTAIPAVRAASTR